MVKTPVNVFRLKGSGLPSSVLNWRLWFAVVSFGLMGAARGIDEGLISGAFDSHDFQHYINLSLYSAAERTNIKANVSAMVQIGSVGGALFAFVVCDRIGRIWATRQLCLFWILGTAIFMANRGSLGAVYAGRFIAGLGVGQTPVVGPVYIAEIAPAPIRGLCTCIFTAFVYVGIVLAYFTNYGAQVHLGDATHGRWLVPTSLHMIFAGMVLVLTLFQSESPRYLVRKGEIDEATAVMARIRCLPRDDAYVVDEMSAIVAAAREEEEEEEENDEERRGPLGVLRDMFLVPGNLYRLYVACTAQIMSQWSGAGSITVYAVDLFRILGVTGSSESLLVTGIFGIVKLVFAVVCALFLVDVIGRKRSLLVGIALQAVAMVYVAGFLTAEPSFSTSFSSSSSRRGAVAMIYVSGAGWALGWNSMQYLLTAELFPLRIRAVCTSVAMVVHFVNQYGSSRAVPNMLLPLGEGGLSPEGTFWLFAAVTMLGGVWVWLCVPETAGRSLESMDRVFALPWYRIGLRGGSA